MTRTPFLSAVALAMLALLTACGGGDAPEENVATQSQPAGVGGIGGSGGAATQGVGGIGGSGGAATQGVGGIGGSGGAATQGVGGSGRAVTQSIGEMAPACALREVDVTIAAVRANADGAADARSAGWVDVALAAPVRVDLLQLAAGGTLPVDLSSLPDGTWHQMRLVLVANDDAAPLADAVVAPDGSEIALAVPTADQGGLPLAPTITVAAGRVSASYRALDVCQAVGASAGTYALGAISNGATQVASAH